ncbi:RNA recognition motif domain [Dillenia turbinata]|uniref:RNA recognition motif domain n=1 Tax=Dillenia turbinata TaxID=194707 RepID=A0AAN8VKR7_9MAGN
MPPSQEDPSSSDEEVDDQPPQLQSETKDYYSDDDDGDDDEDFEIGSEEEDDDDDEDDEDGDGESSKQDTIRELLQPFSKDQLIDLLKQSALSNKSLMKQLISSTQSDPVHRKIFIHGLGWDATKETLVSAFEQYGEIEDCNVVIDKLTGKSKGYGFVLFRTRVGAKKALKQPQKKIGNRMTSCQLAATGPSAMSNTKDNGVTDVSSRKLFVANVGPHVSPEKLRSFFAKFGEIEDGPLGMDKVTGKFRGFAIFVYKTEEGLKKALEEPVKLFLGSKLQCNKASDGKGNQSGVIAASGVSPALGSSNMLSYPLGLNPATIMVGQNAALGGIVNPLLGQVGVGAGVGASLNALQLSPAFPQSGNRTGTAAPVGLSGGFGGQPGINAISPSVIGNYGAQAVLQGLDAYRGSQLGQSSATNVAGTRSQSVLGNVGTLPSYYGH